MSESKSEDPNQYLCGWGPFHPKWLQKFHNPICLAASLMFTKIIHGIMMAGFVPASVSQWSKKFGFKNTQIATINSSFDFASIIGLLVVAHYGNLGHKGRWLGVGIVIYAIGTLIYCVPQFLSQPYEFAGSIGISAGPSPPGVASKISSRYCMPSIGNDSLCEDHGEIGAVSAIDYAFYCFIFASILRGIGSSPLFVLGTTFLDENVSQVRSPKFLGFEMFGAGIGPIGGAVFAAVCLKIYGDVDKNIDLPKILEQITPEDPRWYGAWWIGYLAVGILGFFFAIPILGFARKLPSADEERKHDISQEFKNKGSNKAASGLKDLPMAIINLFRNYCYVAVCFGQVCTAMTFSGLMLFGPKLVEDLFNVDASKALLISALTGIIPASIGMAIGGMLISKLELKLHQIFRYCALCLLVVTPLMGITMLHCDQLPIAGVIAVDYHRRPLTPGAPKMLTDQCNANCGCSGTGFQPVCHKTSGTTYYSPCHAGCLTPVSYGKAIARQWTNCTCLNLQSSSGSNNFESGKSAEVLESGLCSTQCWRLYLFTGLMVLKGGIMGMKLPAMQQCHLRVVGVDQRTLALSMAWIVARVLGTIPGQQIMGTIVDSACEYDGSLSEASSNCPLSKMVTSTRPPRKLRCVRYNSRKLAMTVSSYAIVLTLLGAASYLVASCLYKPADPVLKSELKMKKVRSRDKVIPVKHIFTTQSES